VGATEVTLIAFGAIALCALAGGLVVRDLVYGARGASGSTGRLRRIPDVFDQPAAQGFFGNIDQVFDRLVLESGTELLPNTTFLVMLAAALFTGGTLWLGLDEPLYGVLGGFAGLSVPLAYIVIARGRRMRAIREQFPHVLEMLARATRAGQSVEQAFAMVAEEAGGELAAEFRKCEQQLQMGRAFDRVLKSLSARVRLIEIRIFTTTLIVQRQAGGHLSDTLERMSSVIRDRITAQRQIRAATGAGRMSTLVIAVVSPLVYVLVMIFQRPHFDMLLNDPIGRSLLMLAVILEVTGLIWVFSLMRKED
jgi:tight adherence protein B